MTTHTFESNGHIGVVGGGSIGVAFAILFASSHPVRLYEPDPSRRTELTGEIAERFVTMQSFDLLNDEIETLMHRVIVSDDLGFVVNGASLVQECIPEKIELKRTLFTQLAKLTSQDCVIASSSSFIPTGESAKETGVESRALVAHPGNPPYAIPVIELVPNRATDRDVLQRANELYVSAGMSPVVVEQEIEGFVFNRLQGAVLREAYALVRDGVASVEDIDTVMRDGLGRRWSFMGPFETIDLNTRGGLASHAEKMGPSYHRMGLERGDTSEWTPALVAEVVRQRRQRLPIEQWQQRVNWRDEQLLRRAQRAKKSN